MKMTGKTLTVNNGRASEMEDSDGNMHWYATSAHYPDKEILIWTQGAAEFWLWVQDEIAGSRRIRGVAI